MGNKMIFRKILVLSVAFALLWSPFAFAAIGDEVQGVSDSWLDWMAETLLRNNDRLDFRAVDIEVKDGKIILTGSVETEYEKAKAEALMSAIPNVKAVENNIIVWEDLGEDIVLHKKIRTAVLENPLIHVTAFGLTVKDDVVTLHGVVSSPEQKVRLEKFVRLIPGVKRIVNNIYVGGLTTGSIG